jgi:hypothetical protein
VLGQHACRCTAPTVQHVREAPVQRRDVDLVRALALVGVEQLLEALLLVLHVERVAHVVVGHDAELEPADARDDRLDGLGLVLALAGQLDDQLALALARGGRLADAVGVDALPQRLDGRVDHLPDVAAGRQVVRRLQLVAHGDAALQVETEDDVVGDHGPGRETQDHEGGDQAPNRARGHGLLRTRALVLAADALLADARRLAALAAQVIELGAPHLALAHDLHRDTSGEWKGKTRSTPSPDTMRRTVKVRPTPRP